LGGSDRRSPYEKVSGDPTVIKAYFGRGSLMLTVAKINIFYGKLHILWDLSLKVGGNLWACSGRTGRQNHLIIPFSDWMQPGAGSSIENESLISLGT